MKLLFIAAISLVLCASASPAVHRESGPATRDHVAINVANGPASARFHEQLFGFPPMENPFPGGGGVICLNVRHGIAMHIFSSRKSVAHSERERHLAFGVTDIARVTGYLKAHSRHWQNFDGVVDQMQTRPHDVRPLFFPGSRRLLVGSE